MNLLEYKEKCIGASDKSLVFRFSAGSLISLFLDCLTKKVKKRAAMKYGRDISRRLKHEVPFSEISDLELNGAGVYDKYSSDYTAFNVLGMEVQVSDD